MFFIWSLFFNPPHVNAPIVEDDTCGGTWFANTNVKTTYNQITIFPVEDIFLLKDIQIQIRVCSVPNNTLRGFSVNSFIVSI